MPRFKVVGIEESKGKKRTRHYSALTSADAIKMSENDGLKDCSAKQEDDPPATENQIRFASDLGIQFPEGISKYEISDLITRKYEDDDDHEASAQDKSFATSFGLEHTKYIGEKCLYRGLWYFLNDGNLYISEERDLKIIQWFVYRVSVHLSKNHSSILFNTPFDEKVVEISCRLRSDQRTLKSIKRYEGDKLIDFGNTYEKGSASTIGFKETKREIFNCFDIKIESIPKESSRKSVKPTQEPEVEGDGCAAVVIAAMVIPSTLLIYLLI